MEVVGNSPRLRSSRAPALLAALSLLAASLVGAGPVAAQTDVTLTTPFPSVTIQPGADVSFEIRVGAAVATRVDLSTEGLPEGWTATFRGGGNEVHSVHVTPDAPQMVTLTIDVPPDAAPERTAIAVIGSAGGESTRLELDLVPAADTAGSVSLESDYPALRGSADEEFQFNLTLSNDTPQELVFTLQASGPPGWDVTVQPSGQAAAASVAVPARGTQRLQATAVPAFQAQAGGYPIAVEAVAGEQRAGVQLGVEITGTVAMLLTTPDERLNTTANAGTARAFEVLIFNEGSSPLTSVQLSARAPSEWEVTFEPATIDQLGPQEQSIATAQITPSSNAIAGDYLVTISARTEGAEESIDVRVTVETPPIWGIVGVALIALTLAGMVWVFRRYGRR